MHVRVRVRHRIHAGGPSHSTTSSPLEHVSCGMRCSWRAVQVQLMSHRCLLCPCIEAISCTHEIVATCSVLNVPNHACRVVGESTGNFSHTVHSACLAHLNLCARSSVAACALHYMQTDGAKGINDSSASCSRPSDTAPRPPEARMHALTSTDIITSTASISPLGAHAQTTGHSPPHVQA